jgi:D-cysteine desulfhydrase
MFTWFLLLSNFFAIYADDTTQTSQVELTQGEACGFNFDITAPIFEAYPGLKETLPYTSLGSFPTPVIKAAKLCRFLNDTFDVEVKNLYIKQDNLSGKKIDGSSQIFGGNKVRKLEFLLADAILEEADTVLTVGTAGSNHALASAVYSKLLGLDCIIMLTPQENASYVKRNLLMDLYYSPTIKAYDTDANRKVDIFNTSRKLILDGKKSPYFIPSGGSNKVGAIGFVNAAFELKEQINQNLLPEPDLIYVTLGSGGTAAGLILGCKAAGLKTKVVAVKICGDSKKKESELASIIKETNSHLNLYDPNFPIFEITKDDYIFRDDFAGEKYALITKEATLAIKLMYDFEKITLDGTYTGKTFAALLFDLLQNADLKNKTVLFWDTYCSGDFSEIINSQDYKKLPELLQIYFKIPVQQFDQGC